jgi:hypothetical protein
LWQGQKASGAQWGGGGLVAGPWPRWWMAVHTPAGRPAVGRHLARRPAGPTCGVARYSESVRRAERRSGGAARRAAVRGTREGRRARGGRSASGRRPAGRPAERTGPNRARIHPMPHPRSHSQPPSAPRKQIRHRARAHPRPARHGRRRPSTAVTCRGAAARRRQVRPRPTAHVLPTRPVTRPAPLSSGFPLQS